MLTSESGKQSAAVRLALGETQIVADTREFLEEQGVVLDAFSRPPSSRSKTVLIIKNLPIKTPVEEIRDMFSKHGELGRVILPPNGITAIVEFNEPSEAKNAFRRLAYTNYKGTPLYLEWAPEETFKPKTEEQKEHNCNILKPDDGTSGMKTEITPPENNTILFVKNLNFETTDNGLRTHFEEICGVGSLHSATISRYLAIYIPIF